MILPHGERHHSSPHESARTEAVTLITEGHVPDNIYELVSSTPDIGYGHGQSSNAAVTPRPGRGGWNRRGRRRLGYGRFTRTAAA